MASITKYTAKRARAGYLWRVQYRDPSGRGRTKSGFTKKAEAEAWAARNDATLAAGEWVDPAATKITIKVLGTRWLASQTHLKPTTMVFTKHIWDNYIDPQWGTRRVGAIMPSEVQEWVATMGKSASTVRHAHNQLAQILDVAVRDRMIRTNPARGVKLPRKAKPKHVFWPMQYLLWLAEEAKSHREELEALVLLLGTSGPRWGEAAALRPMDLDPLRNRVRIERNAVRVGTKMMIGTPKTHEQRSIAVAGSVMAKIMEVAEKRKPGDLLWPSGKGTLMQSPGKGTWFDGAMKRVIEEHPEVPRVSPHGLRHVAAGLLVESGANVKAVQLQLGHASAKMTLDTYAALFEDGLDAVADALDNLVVDLSSISPREQGLSRSEGYSG